MAGWKRTVVDGLPLHQATTISWLPGIVQGFTTRQGGVSAKPYDTLNMSLAVSDTAENVAENRNRAVRALASEQLPVLSASQVHGNHVEVVGVDSVSGPLPECDGMITKATDLLLLMVFADCVPIFFCDPVGRAVGIAHSGWRGTAGNVAGHTVSAFEREFDIHAGAIYAAIGPSIGADRYEVDIDVVDFLTRAWPGGSSTPMIPKNEFTNRWMCNLRLIVFDQLVSAGLRPERIAVSDECTYRNSKDFFSHRRDSKKGQATGRMAGLIGMRPLGVGSGWPAD